MTDTETGNDLRVDPTLRLSLEELAPGVRGAAVRTAAALYVPLVIADVEGRGDVGRYLDGLPTSETLRFPNVISTRLAGMLARRGFRLTEEWAEEFQSTVPVWERAGRKP
jgi:hypothetical protein